MRLAGQGASRGYAMAALLVGMSVMSVVMGALLPVWTQMMTRDKEEELIFRGNQYARAIGLFQRKFANTNPPTIDLLVEQRFLRKKYLDPITNEEFQPIYASQAQQGVGALAGAQRPGEQATEAVRPPAQQTLQSGFGGTAATGAGGIIGVTSKSTETSIRVYNGRTRYNEWAFVYVQTSQQPGGPGGAAPGTQQPGQRGPGGVGPGSQGRPGQAPGASPFGPGAAQPSRPPVGTPVQRPPGDVR